MFNNISSKLKVWAIITTIIGNISAIISGISLISQGEGFETIGIVIMFAGILSSWLTAWVLFGLGDLLDTTDAIYSEVKENSYCIEHISNNISILLDRTKETDFDIPKETKEVLPNDTSKIDNNSKSAQAIANESDTMITCSLCDFKQPANRKVCWQCGAKFEKR